jgi:hypothetical protein
MTIKKLFKPGIKKPTIINYERHQIPDLDQDNVTKPD